MISWILFWVCTFVGTTWILGKMHSKWEKEAHVQEMKNLQRQVDLVSRRSVRVFNGRTITPKRVPAWDASGNIPAIVYIPTPPAAPPCL